MKFTTKTNAIKTTGIYGLGHVSKTVKHMKSIKFNELTYALYLSPANQSGYETCPGRSDECTALCLSNSGMNRMVMNDDRITKSRIKKTKMFFENRPYFMDWLIAEIKNGKKLADKKGFSFSVRLNNTSDIDPREFYVIKNGVKQNILELFPDVMFYDYSKVLSRLELPKLYDNYNLTYSYSGYNMKQCMDAINNGVNIAIVFKNVPPTFNGFEVIDGDKNDLRYRDGKGVVVGLKFKRVRDKLPINSKFVIQ
jgi:hypothetical protein